MKDILDREIEVGDRVAYAIRNSCTAELVLATVLEVEKTQATVQRDKPTFSWRTEQPRPGIIRFADRVIIVERPGKVAA